ncbi:hypothetical protein GCM10022419_033250 [Nonomuraea rosea]|uniref:Secreted protein n=1 Tax=Nonomuraea rosea TaxID=638574 RepID=A0ABP6WEV2_9ACTN
MANYAPGFGPHPQQPGWPPAAPYVPHQPVRRRKPWLSYTLTILVSLIVGVGLGSSGEADTTAASSRPTVTVTETERAEPVTVTETVTAKPEQAAVEDSGPLTTIPGDGQYLVGEDAKAGTYKTAGADGYNCYWASLKDASGEFGAIIANDNVKGQTWMTHKKGEYFKTNSCQGRTRVG